MHYQSRLRYVFKCREYVLLSIFFFFFIIFLLYTLLFTSEDTDPHGTPWTSNLLLVLSPSCNQENKHTLAEAKLQQFRCLINAVSSSAFVRHHPRFCNTCISAYEKKLVIHLEQIWIQTVTHSTHEKN